MKQIHEYLGISEERYEALVVHTFLNWAQQYVIKPTDWQLIIANAKISKWFRNELSELEKDFVEEVKSYEGVLHDTTLHFKTVWHRHMVRIHGLFPKPLLNEVRQIQISRPPIRHNDILLFSHLHYN